MSGVIPRLSFVRSGHYNDWAIPAHPNPSIKLRLNFRTVEPISLSPCLLYCSRAALIDRQCQSDPCPPMLIYTECPTHYRTPHFFNNFTTNEDIATKFEADWPHCVRNVKDKNVLLFKFRCNIFIGVRIIKEMPGSVASGTPCIYCIQWSHMTYCYFITLHFKNIRSKAKVLLR